MSCFLGTVYVSLHFTYRYLLTAS